MSCRAILVVALFITASGPASAADKAFSRWPDGTGDPDGVTCRPPQQLPASRFMGPEVCKTNSQWALLRKDREDISADGAHVIPDPSGAGSMPMHCSVSGGGASSGGAMSCH